MENGFSPCDKAPNRQQTYIVAGQPWTPRNASHARYGQMVTLKWGLAQSNNWISAYLMGKLNPYDLVRLIHSFGVRNKAIDPVVSLCLGPCEISVGEMVSAYTAFANKGIRVAPLFVTRIEDSDGNVISTFAPQMEEVISASSTYKMLVMLRAVINEGTGGRVRRYGITADMGGKTGTTNDNSDAWFMGFTPSLVSGCWVGGDERDIHFGRMTYGQGAAAALPIWAMYMKKVYDDPTLGYDQQEKFKLPEGFDPCAGSSVHDLFVTMNKEIQVYSDTLNTLMERYADEYLVPESEGKDVSAVGMEIAREEMKWKDKLLQYQLDFIKKHADSPVAMDQAMYYLSGMEFLPDVKEIDQMQAFPRSKSSAHLIE
jgi:penicillin-binding protein 1A